MTKSYRKPHQVRRKKTAARKARRFIPGKRFFLSVLLFSAAGGAAYAGTFSSFIQLQTVEAEGAVRIDGAEAQALVRREVGRKFWFWTSESMLLLNTSRAAERMRETYPAAESVSLDRTLLKRSLRLKIQERREAAFWCPRAEQCLLVDRAGIAFAPLQEEDVPELLLAGKEGGVGSHAIDSVLLEQALAFKRPFFALELKDIEAVSFDILSPSRVNVRTSEGWDIYANPSGDLEWQLTKLRAVLEQKIAPEDRARLDYIDLRFGDQAYYR